MGAPPEQPIHIANVTQEVGKRVVFFVHMNQQRIKIQGDHSISRQYCWYTIID